MITQIKKSQNDEMTEQIIGCCFRVHTALGPGFPEKVYQAALTESLRASDLSVEEERSFKVLFEGTQVGTFRVDLLIENRVVVEVKAVTGMLPKVFAAQVLAYLKAADMPVGLLVNFGNASCQVKRISFSSAKSALSLSAKSILKSAESMKTPVISQ